MSISFDSFFALWVALPWCSITSDRRSFSISEQTGPSLYYFITARVLDLHAIKYAQRILKEIRILCAT